DEISSACERDELIEGTISQRVKGGLSVTIRGGVKAFLPGSQVDLRPVRNLDKLIGQTYEFKVIKFNKKRGNIVLSRRVLLEKERDTMKARTLETLQEGMVLDGVIKNLTEYGAFVDLGGIDGLLHITDMSWGRVNHPSEVFKVGDEVSVDGMVHKTHLSWTIKVNNPADLYSKGDEVSAIILSINHDEKKVSLGVRQVFDDPWGTLLDKYRPGAVVEQVTVLRVA